MQTAKIIELAATHPALDHSALARALGWSASDVEWAERFWSIVHNDAEFLITREMVTDWFGYKPSRDIMATFRGDTLGKHTEDTDYRFADLADPLVVEYIRTRDPSSGNAKPASRTKWLVVRGRTLKHMLMRTGTARGSEVRDYYVRVEELAQTFVMYSSQCELAACRGEADRELAAYRSAARDQSARERELTEHCSATERELTEARAQIARLDQVNTAFLERYEQHLTRHQTIYVLTSPSYQARDMYKIGFTSAGAAKSRVGNMNTGYPLADSLQAVREWRVADGRQVETRIRECLAAYRDSSAREWYTLPLALVHDAIAIVVESYERDVGARNWVACQVNAIRCGRIAVPSASNDVLSVTTGMAALGIEGAAEPGTSSQPHPPPPPPPPPRVRAARAAKLPVMADSDTLLAMDDESATRHLEGALATYLEDPTFAFTTSHRVYVDWRHFKYHLTRLHRTHGSKLDVVAWRHRLDRISRSYNSPLDMVVRKQKVDSLRT